MVDEPVEFRVRRGRAVGLGAVFLVFACLGADMAVDPSETFRRSPEYQRFVGVLGAIVGGGMVLYCGWLAYVRPVGLRLDRNGIEGYYVGVPLAWSEFAELGRTRSNTFGRVRLRAVEAVADRYKTKGWKALAANPVSRWHVDIPAAMIGLTRNQLAALLRQWHLRHAGSEVAAKGR